MKTFPSLAGLTSLEEFELRGLQKVDKVEGLEVLRSLKKLAVHMCSMRPWMLKLPEQSERLKSVEVVANRLGVVEPSIREMQKWPREEIICTWAVIDVMSLRKFFTSSILPEDVVQTYSSRSSGGIRLRMPESAANTNAILICTIIHSIHPNVKFYISTDRKNHFYASGMSNGERVGMGNLPQESIWLWMGIFPEESDWLHSEEYNIRVYIEGEVFKERWMLRGREQSIRKAFHQLSQR